MVSVKVEVTTIPTAELLGGMRKFFGTVMLAAHADVAVAGRVPKDSGHLGNSLSPGNGVTMVDPAEPPKWAAVGVASMTNDKGGDTAVYGMALEDPRGRNPHYRDGPSKGQPTAGWLSKTLPNIEGAVQDALAELAASMEGAHRGA